MTGEQYDAYWVPGLAHEMERDDSLSTGLGWLGEAESAYGRPGTVVMYAKTMIGNARLLGDAATRWPVVSPRSHDAYRSGPALAIWPPDDRTLELAERIAHGAALCVIPGTRLDISPWIRQTAARCLVDGFEAAPAAALPAGVTESLDHMLFFGGHNGFLGGGEKEDAIRRLHDIARRVDRPTREQLEEYLRASGESRSDGVCRIGTWYEEVLAGKRHRDYAGRVIVQP